MTEIRNVSYTYPDGNDVLHDVSAVFPEGCVTAVLGPNGAGKTTLFRCMLGLLPRYRGHVILDGNDLRDMSPSERAEHIAYIPQRCDRDSGLTVNEFVVMGSIHTLSLIGNPGSRQQKAADEAINLLGIGSIRDRLVSTLSGGERQMVLIARALCQQSGTLLMDEPDASLDPAHVNRVLSAAGMLAEKGHTVILSTHRPEYADRYASHILMMKDGRVVASGSSDQVITGELLSDLYGTEVRVINVDGQRYIRLYP